MLNANDVVDYNYKVGHLNAHCKPFKQKGTKIEITAVC